MTDDTNGETTDEPTDDWPKQWEEITQSDNQRGDAPEARCSTIDPGLPMVDFGHGVRAYDGTVYVSLDDADPPVLWEPLGVHVDRMVAEALEERTIDPGELVDRAIERELHRRDSNALRKAGRRGGSE